MKKRIFLQFLLVLLISATTTIVAYAEGDLGNNE